MKLPISSATDAARQSPRSVNPDSWVDQHGDFLYRYALLRVRHPEVAEDLVQETLFAAVRTHTNLGEARPSEVGFVVFKKTRSAIISGSLPTRARLPT